MDRKPLFSLTDLQAGEMGGSQITEARLQPGLLDASEKTCRSTQIDEECKNLKTYKEQP